MVMAVPPWLWICRTSYVEVAYVLEVAYVQGVRGVHIVYTSHSLFKRKKKQTPNPLHTYIPPQQSHDTPSSNARLHVRSYFVSALFILAHCFIKAYYDASVEAAGAEP